MSLAKPEIMSFDLPARYRYLHVLSACVADMLGLVDGLVDAEALVYNTQLAAHEICTNIIDHAYERKESDRNRIKVQLAIHPSPLRLEIIFRDSGRSFALSSVPTPDLENAQVHGYGLFLVHNLMDNVVYTPEPQGNRWHLVKRLNVEGG